MMNRHQLQCLSILIESLRDRETVVSVALRGDDERFMHVVFDDVDSYIYTKGAEISNAQTEVRLEWQDYDNMDDLRTAFRVAVDQVLKRKHT